MTPAIRALEAAGVSATIHRYENDPEAESYGLEAAAQLHIAPERLFKTLIVQIDGGKLVMVMVPAAARLDLKKFARVVGSKRAVLAEVAVAERTTGYIVGGISPLGGRKVLSAYIDVSALTFETVTVSAGQRGLMMELTPDALIRLTAAQPAAIIG